MIRMVGILLIGKMVLKKFSSYNAIFSIVSFCAFETAQFIGTNFIFCPKQKTLAKRNKTTGRNFFMLKRKTFCNKIKMPLCNWLNPAYSNIHFAIFIPTIIQLYTTTLHSRDIHVAE